MFSFPLLNTRSLLDINGDECWLGTYLRRMKNQGTEVARVHEEDKADDPSSIFITNRRSHPYQSYYLRL